MDFRSGIDGEARPRDGLDTRDGKKNCRGLAQDVMTVAVCGRYKDDAEAAPAYFIGHIGSHRLEAQIAEDFLDRFAAGLCKHNVLQ